MGFSGGVFVSVARCGHNFITVDSFILKEVLACTHAGKPADDTNSQSFRPRARGATSPSRKHAAPDPFQPAQPVCSFLVPECQPKRVPALLRSGRMSARFLAQLAGTHGGIAALDLKDRDHAGIIADGPQEARTSRRRDLLMSAIVTRIDTAPASSRPSGIRSSRTANTGR
jgi:hypothetical protein